MAASISLSPTNPSVYDVVTSTGSGFTASANYLVTITAGGATQTIATTTDASGGFSVSFVCQTPDTYTVKAALQNASNEATATLTCVD